jgi:hypothetical protein
MADSSLYRLRADFPSHFHPLPEGLPQGVPQREPVDRISTKPEATQDISIFARILNLGGAQLGKKNIEDDKKEHRMMSGRSSLAHVSTALVNMNNLLIRRKKFAHPLKHCQNSLIFPRSHPPCTSFWP